MSINNKKILFDADRSFKENKNKKISLSGSIVIWAKIETYRILRGYNKKQRGLALEEMIDSFIEELSEEDNLKFKKLYEEILKNKE